MRKILCVDDDEDSRILLEALLGKSGDQIEIKAVATAEDAVALIAAEHFDLYILDNWLPDRSGVELCRWIRVADSETPIIFLSGASYEKDKLDAIAAGANEYLVKPNDLALLHNIVDKLLEK